MEHLGDFDYFLDLCIMDGCFLTFFQCLSRNSHYFFHPREEIGGQLWNIPDISRESTHAKITHTKDELFNPSYA